MESNYRSFNPPYQVTDQEDRENSFESGGDSPPSTTFGTSTTSCLKRSRRAIEKRVVTIPMKDVDGSRFKGDFTPPSDSWAWRKYGQKPIKGSPYPRGYYRCSSSKGCPARKQVERSRLDPNMLVVAYSYEHNHPWPATSKHHRNNHHNATARSTPATTSLPNPSSPKLEEQSLQAESPQRHPIKLEQYREEAEIFSNPRDNDKFTHLGDEPLVTSDEFGWFSTDVASTSSSSVAGFGGFGDLAIGEYFPMGEEEGSLFADLGELPECSVVFRHREAAVAATATVEEEAEQQRCSLMPAWFGATG